MGALLYVVGIIGSIVMAVLGIYMASVPLERNTIVRWMRRFETR